MAQIFENQTTKAIEIAEHMRRTRFPGVKKPFLCEVVHQENFTVALVYYSVGRGERMSVGVSKRNPGADRVSRNETGIGFAISRALKETM